MKKLVNKINKEIIGLSVSLILLIVLLSILSPNFLDLYNISNISRQVSINMIIAMGMTFVIISSGIDLSVGSILAVSSVVMASMMNNYNMNIFVAILIGITAGVILGFINGVVISEFKLPPFIGTLGMMTIARGIAFVYTDAYPISGFSDSFRFIGQGVILGIPLPIIIAAFTLLLSHFILKYTPIGTHIFAIGNNEESARLSGIDIKRTQRFIYAFSGAMVAISAIIVTSRLNSGQPNVGQGYELDAIAAVVLGGASLEGGKGNILGTVLGVLIIGVLNNGMNLLGVSPYYQLIVKGLVILIAVAINSRKEKVK